MTISFLFIIWRSFYNFLVCDLLLSHRVVLVNLHCPNYIAVGLDNRFKVKFMDGPRKLFIRMKARALFDRYIVFLKIHLYLKEGKTCLQGGGEDDK